MTRRRVHAYMLGAWVGGVWVTLLALAAVLGSTLLIVLWAALSAALGGSLLVALGRDERAGRFQNRARPS